jgi:hypothetical protein
MAHCCPECSITLPDKTTDCPECEWVEEDEEEDNERGERDHPMQGARPPPPTDPPSRHKVQIGGDQEESLEKLHKTYGDVFSPTVTVQDSEGNEKVIPLESVDVEIENRLE